MGAISPRADARKSNRPSVHRTGSTSEPEPPRSMTRWLGKSPTCRGGRCMRGPPGRPKETRMSKRLVVPMVLMACLALPSAGLAAPRDRDHDRLPDRWEKRNGINTSSASGKQDPDHDGLVNRREYKLRTDPRARDTDKDGISTARRSSAIARTRASATPTATASPTAPSWRRAAIPRARKSRPAAAQPVGPFVPAAVESLLDDPPLPLPLPIPIPIPIPTPSPTRRRPPRARPRRPTTRRPT